MPETHHNNFPRQYVGRARTLGCVFTRDVSVTITSSADSQQLEDCICGTGAFGLTCDTSRYHR